MSIIVWWETKCWACSYSQPAAAPEIKLSPQSLWEESALLEVLLQKVQGWFTHLYKAKVLPQKMMWWAHQSVMSSVPRSHLSKTSADFHQ